MFGKSFRKGSSFLTALGVISVLFLVVFSLSPAMSGEIERENATYRLVTPGELKEMLAHKDFLLVNVSFRCMGYIPGTDREIPFNLIEKFADTFPSPDTSKIVLYCNRGYMSRVAAGKLVKMGFKQVYVLKGGLEGWRLAGNKVVLR